ncbi:MAG: 5'-methylthioadenosine/S-adenosylhomocysteine nucleosidase [Chloroflexi bacterium]|nr:5'-methylthioadenosine/S-adenosylhomocysteine nucleosidase [Chloroflexota bacterium]MBV9603035.1 5'-methylthioadenosine/S-adenosylhomocysteine nucleosidase [Chloroflexota bacterium]
MTHPLVVMALESESQGRLEKLGCEVLYTGLGKVNAAHGLTRRLHRAPTGTFSYVLNLGSAGSGTFHTGSLVAADRFVQRDMDMTPVGFEYGETPYEDISAMLSFPRRFPHLPHGICGTGDCFSQGPPPVPCDIVDMEAYALAKVCHVECVPFACVKYITDGADHNAHADWQENLVEAARIFETLLTSESVVAARP